MKVKLVKKQPEIENVFTFIFEADKKVSWKPGQYLHYDLPHPHEDDRGIGRFFTISAAPFENHLSITTRFDPQRSSTFKLALQKLEIGQTLEAGEPRGEFLLDSDASKHILIAGGIGITPYRSQLVQMDHDGKEIKADLLYANRDENFVFGGLLAGLEQKYSDFKVLKFIGDKRITEADLKNYLMDESIIFYLSGPRPMVEAYEHLLIDLDVNPERIRTDYFPGYKLG